MSQEEEDRQKSPSGSGALAGIMMSGGEGGASYSGSMGGYVPVGTNGLPNMIPSSGPPNPHPDMASLPVGLPSAGPGKIDRSQFAAELQNPEVRAAFIARMHSEVGNDPQAQLAFAETIFNRAASRHQTLMQTLYGRYYPTSEPGRDYVYGPDYYHGKSSKYYQEHDRQHKQAEDNILKAYSEGTDTTHGATGNASGSVGFGARGWRTVSYGGENFGVEECDLKWHDQYASGSFSSQPHYAGKPTDTHTARTETKPPSTQKTRYSMNDYKRNWAGVMFSPTPWMV